MILQLYQLSWWFNHDTMVYHDSKTNSKITEPLFLMPAIPHSNSKFVMVQWMIYTRTTIMQYISEFIQQKS